MTTNSPIYHDDLTHIYHDDCANVYTQLDRESVDLVVTSPPFNVGMPYELNVWRTLDEYLRFIRDRFIHLYSIMASGGWVIVELADAYISPEHPHAVKGQKEAISMATSAHLTVAMIKHGFLYKGHAVWSRGRWSGLLASRLISAPGSPTIMAQHSNVYFYRKPGGRHGAFDHNLMPDSWRAQWLRSVWGHIRPVSNKAHPAVMPYSLAVNLIMGWSYDGHTILDPFAGSGTTIRAAKDLHRQSIAIEIDYDYCKAMILRQRQNAFPLTFVG